MWVNVLKIKLFKKYTISTNWTAERIFQYCKNNKLEITTTGGSHIFIHKEDIESFYYLIEFKDRKLDQKIVLIQKNLRGTGWYKTTDGSPKEIYRDRNVMRLVH